MSEPDNSIIRQFIEHHPQNWGQLLGLPPPDKLWKVNHPEKPYIAHIELHASDKEDIAGRFMTYNIRMYQRTGIPVYSTFILLRPEADRPALHDPYVDYIKSRESDEPPFFRVIRLWEEPVESYLESGLSMAPLAVLCAITLSELPDVLRRIGERIERESPDSAWSWTKVYLVMGLRYTMETIERLLEGAPDIKESITYQAILEEGEAIGEARGELKILLLLGRKRLGEPSMETLATLQSIAQVGILESLGIRLLEVESWGELLAAL